MKRNANHFSNDFSMTHHEELPRVLHLFAERKLQPRDMVLVEALRSHLSIGTGRVRITLQAVAELLKTKPQDIHSSYARLQRNDIIIRCKDRAGNRFFLFNPRYISVGDRERFNKLRAQYDKAKATGGEVNELATVLMGGDDE
jgi:hypothetical protein